MKPIRLTMQSFGSYKDKTVIDFTKLDGNGIFLITGDTGSGKSTIFDACFYALYDDLSVNITGNEKNEKYVSQYRTDMTKDVYVEFEFTEKKGDKENTYIIRRNPTYIRKKKTGTGETEEKAKCTLRIISGDTEKEEQTYKKDINDNIKEIVGLEKDEFRQIAMIAQGEFMNILRAKAEDRRNIFRKLFNTGIYRSIEDKLKDKVKGMVADLGNFIEKYKNDVVRIDSNGEFEQNSERQELYNELEYLKSEILAMSEKEYSHNRIENLVGVLEKVCIDLKQRELEAKQNKDIAKEARDKAHEEYSTNEALKSSFDGLRVEKEKLKASNAKKADIEAKEMLVDTIKKSYEVKALYDIFADKKDSYNKLLEDIKYCQDNIPKLEEQVYKCDKELNNIKEERDTINKNQIKIEEKVKNDKIGLKIKEELHEKIKTNESKQNNLVKDIEKVTKAIADIREQSEKDKCRKEELKDARVNGEKIKFQIEMIDQFTHDVNNTTDIIENTKKLFGEWDDIKETYETARIDYAQVNDRYERKYKAFLDSQAGYIAERLRENDPCPVCGSIEHPSPCKLSSDSVTKEEVDKCKKDLDAIRKKTEKLSQDSGLKKQSIKDKCKIIRKDIESYIKKLEEDSSLKTIEAIISSNERKIISNTIDCDMSYLDMCIEILDRISKRLFINKNELSEIYEKLSADILELEEIEKRENDSQSNLDIRNEEKEKYERELQEVKSAINSDKQRIVDINNSLEYKSVEDADNAFKTIEDEYNTIESKYDDKKSTYDRLKEKQTTVKTLLDKYKKNEPESKHAVSESESTYNNALVDKKISEDMWIQTTETYSKDSIEELNREINDYNNEHLRITTAIKTHQDAIAGKEELDLAELRISKENSDKEFVKCDEIYNKIKLQYTTNSDILKSLSDNLSKRNECEEEYNKIESLSRKINGGDSGSRLHLETYVQRYFLKQILSSANKRFINMTDGQYELRIVDDERANMGGAGGSDSKSLNLVVYSYENDSVRNVETLSGGESFMASLSLALGMADQIEEKSSAVNLDIMFIDEGFGSLDDNARRQAIKILQKMANGKKQVGIISHVTELKQEIPTQLKVTKDEDGSHISMQIN